MAGERVLLVDPSPSRRAVLKRLLKEEKGLEAVEASTCEDALARLEVEKVTLVLSETDLPNKSGLYLLKAVKESNPHLPVVLFTENESSHAVLQAIRLGAYDFVVRPAESIEILGNTLQRALEHGRLRRQNADLLQELGRKNATLLRSLDMMKALNASVEELAVAPDSEHLLKGLLACATKALGCRRGFLALRDRASGELGIKVSQGIPAEVSHELTSGMPPGLCTEIARRGKPVLVPGRLPESLASFTHAVELGSLLAHPGLLAVPLSLKGRMVGVVVLSGCGPGNLLGEHELHFLIQLSHHATLALEKAGIIHQLKRARAATVDDAASAPAAAAGDAPHGGPSRASRATPRKRRLKRKPRRGR